MRTYLAFTILATLLVQQISASQEEDAVEHHRQKRQTVSLLGRFKHQVSVYAVGKGFCEGSILSNNRILTAAHCVHNVAFSLISVCAGRLNVNQTAVQAGLTCGVAFFVDVHAQYNSTNLDYDVAIIRLAIPLFFSSSIGAVRLPRYTTTATADLTGTAAVAASWKWFNASGFFQTPLMYANFSISSNGDCSAYYTNYKNVSVSSQTSCYVPTSVSASCAANAGGALLITETDGIFTQIAVLVRAAASCSVTTPQVSYRVDAAALLDWIYVKAGITKRV